MRPPWPGNKLVSSSSTVTSTYYENIEGGHGGAANNNSAFMSTLAYDFLERLAGESGSDAPVSASGEYNPSKRYTNSVPPPVGSEHLYIYI